MAYILCGSADQFVVLQARMFAYPDAARYRLGANYQQLPSNRAHVNVYNPYERDGRARIDGNYGGDPDYVGSELRPLQVSTRHTFPTHEHWSGRVQIYSAAGATEKDYEQPRILWHMIQKEGSTESFMDNICPTLLDVKPSLQDQVYGMTPRQRRKTIFCAILTAVIAYFSGVDPELGQSIKDGVERRAKKA